MLAEVAVIHIPDSEAGDLPRNLASWHHLGCRITFTVGDAHFTQFEAADTDALFAIRNDPSVTPFMPAGRPIPYEQHVAWVAARILARDEDTPLILVGRIAGQPVGFGLLKPTGENGTLEIGIILTAAGQRSAVPLKLAAALIALADRVFGARTLISYVNRDHHDALRLNRAAGLVKMAESNKPGELFFRTPVAVAASTPLYRRCIRDMRIDIVRQ